MIGANNGPGIVQSGSEPDSLFCIHNSITGNVIVNYGTESSSTSGAILSDQTRGTSITGNSILYPGSMGIGLKKGNHGFSCTGNSIKDVWSDSVIAPRYISVRLEDNRGVVGNNSFLREDTSYGTFVGVRGFETAVSTDVSITLNDNYNEAQTKYVISSGSLRNAPTVQSGTVSGTASTGSAELDIVVTFDEPFTSTPDITVSTNRTSGNPNATNTVHVTSESTTGFTAKVATTDKNNFNSAAAFDVFWQATGV